MLWNFSAELIELLRRHSSTVFCHLLVRIFSVVLHQKRSLRVHVLLVIGDGGNVGLNHKGRVVLVRRHFLNRYFAFYSWLFRLEIFIGVGSVVGRRPHSEIKSRAIDGWVEMGVVIYGLLLQDPLEVGHICQFSKGDSFCLIDFHATEDNLFNLVRKLRSDFRLGNRKREVLLQFLFCSARRKGCFAMEQLIYENSKSPDIGFGSVDVVDEAFGSHVNRRSDIDVLEFLSK
jgi:hypothetical protein